MAELPWFPLYVADWSKLTVGLTLEERGAFVELCHRAWVDPTEPGTIPATDFELSRVLGSKWKRFAPMLDRLFPLSDGRRRSPWLIDLYAKQLAKHIGAVEKGRKGGRPRKAKSATPRKAEEQAATKGEQKAQKKAEVLKSKVGVISLLSSLSRENSEGEHTASYEAECVPPAGAALALEGARGPAGEPPPRDDRDERQRLERDARQWAAEHPDDAAEIERSVRVKMGVPATGPLKPMADTLVRTVVVQELAAAARA